MEVENLELDITILSFKELLKEEFFLIGNKPKSTKQINELVIRLKEFITGKQAKNEKDNNGDLFKTVLIEFNSAFPKAETKYKDKMLKTLSSLLEALNKIICKIINSIKENTCYDFLNSKIELNITFKLLIESIKSVIIAVPLVKTFLFLLKSNLFNIIMKKENIVDFFLSEFNYDKFPVPTYTQETRSFFIRILWYLTENYFDIIITSKPDTFIVLCLSDIEGEKDPRNILLSMDFLSELGKRLNEKQILDHQEMIVNIFEDYYPVEFSPPKNSPMKITQIDLSDSLNKAMFSNIHLLPEIWETILKDRVLTDTVDSKFEVFKSINYFLNKFITEDFTDSFVSFIKIDILNQIWKEVFDMIVTEIINNVSEEVHFECIKSLTLIIKYSSSLYCLLKSGKNDKIIDDFVLQNMLIYQLFEKSLDWIFSSEVSKNSYDARDILLILLEYSTKISIDDRSYTKIKESAEVILTNKKISNKLQTLDKYIQQSSDYYYFETQIIEFFIKSISLFTTTKGKSFILRNMSSVVIYLLKKNKIDFIINDNPDNSYKEIRIKLKQVLSKLVIKELDIRTDMKEDVFDITQSKVEVSSENQDTNEKELLVLLDLIVSFSVLSRVFNDEELKGIFSKIKRFWYSISSEEIIERICVYLKDMIKTHSYLSDLTQVFHDINNIIFLSSNHNAVKLNENINIDNLKKHFILLKEYSIFSKLDIIKYCFNLIKKIQISDKNSCSYRQIYTLIIELLMNIELKNNVDKKCCSSSKIKSNNEENDTGCCSKNDNNKTSCCKSQSTDSRDKSDVLKNDNIITDKSNITELISTSTCLFKCLIDLLDNIQQQRIVLNEHFNNLIKELLDHIYSSYCHKLFDNLFELKQNHTEILEALNNSIKQIHLIFIQISQNKLDSYSKLDFTINFYSFIINQSYFNKEINIIENKDFINVFSRIKETLFTFINSQYNSNNPYKYLTDNIEIIEKSNKIKIKLTYLLNNTVSLEIQNEISVYSNINDKSNIEIKAIIDKSDSNEIEKFKEKIYSLTNEMSLHCAYINYLLDNGNIELVIKEIVVLLNSISFYQPKNKLNQFNTFIFQLNIFKQLNIDNDKVFIVFELISKYLEKVSPKTNSKEEIDCFYLFLINLSIKLFKNLDMESVKSNIKTVFPIVIQSLNYNNTEKEAIEFFKALIVICESDTLKNQFNETVSVKSIIENLIKVS